MVTRDEALRIVPQDLWDTVQTLRTQRRRTWPGGKGKRGFSAEQGSRETHFPTHLFSGAMKCAECGGSIVQVGGKSGGYLGCLARRNSACGNKVLVRRTIAEQVLIGAIRREMSDPKHIHYILTRVEAEIAKLKADLPQTVSLKEKELADEEARVRNLVDYISGGLLPAAPSMTLSSRVSARSSASKPRSRACADLASACTKSRRSSGSSTR